MWTIRKRKRFQNRNELKMISESWNCFANWELLYFVSRYKIESTKTYLKLCGNEIVVQNLFGASIFICVQIRHQLALNKFSNCFQLCREMKKIVEHSLPRSNEKCHSSESLRRFVHEFPSELKFHRDDAPARSQYLQSHDRIRKTRDSSTIDTIRHQVSQAATSHTNLKSHWR